MFVSVFALSLRHNNPRTGTLRIGVRRWPIRVCARSVTRDRVRAVECEAVVTTKRCLTAVVVIASFAHGAILRCVGVTARALSAGAGTAGCGAVPGDRASVSGVARAREAIGVVGMLNVALSHCRNMDACIVVCLNKSTKPFILQRNPATQY